MAEDEAQVVRRLKINSRGEFVLVREADDDADSPDAQSDQSFVVPIFGMTLGELSQSRTLKAAVAHKIFLKRAEQLLPGYRPPYDTLRLAAILCQRTGLQPSEFKKMNTMQRIAFLELAISDLSLIHI